MQQHRKEQTKKSINQVDPNFVPWEQSHPIPLLVLAICLVLGFWGVLSYLDDLSPLRQSLLAENGSAVSQTTAVTPTTPVKAPPPLVASGNEMIWGCASCHGDAGQGSGQTPALAGLDRSYLKKQLADFQAKTRHNESMVYVADHLSATDIENMAVYYSSLPVTPPANTNMSATMERGKALALHGDWSKNIPSCASCHGQNYAGVGSTFPRLAGQQPEYMLSQLAAWKGGQRINSPQSLMEEIAGRMSDEDMRAVAQYLGSLPTSAEEAKHE